MSYLVEDVDDACLEVVVVRGNGRAGDPETLCYPQ
jgi:hypothetical protein